MGAGYISTFIGVLLGFVIPSVTVGQNKSGDLEKVIRNYSGDSPISYDLQYSKYYDKVEGEPVEVLLGKVVQYQGQRYHKLGELEVIDVPEYTLVADHEQGKIMFSPVIKVPGPNGENIRRNKQPAMEDILKFCNIDTVIKINSSTALFKLTATVEGGGKLNLYYNPSTFLIKELQIFYEQEEKRLVNAKEVISRPVLVVKYSNYNMKDLPADTFSYTRFLVKEGKKVTLKSGYAKYRYFGPDTY